MADELDVYSEFVEKVFQEDELGADTCHHVVASFIVAHIDFVGYGSQIVAAGCRVFYV